MDGGVDRVSCSLEVHLTEVTIRQLPRTLATEIGQSPSVFF